MMTQKRPICVLLAALGGQGGGVLMTWLGEAARHAGFPAQSTSIPGVAQRTGATTYYFEVYPDKNPPSDPVFSLYPSAGDVDIAAALEPLEAGRMLERGFVSRRTVVITALERVYAISEKMVAGEGTADTAPVFAALGRAARHLIAFHAGEAAGRVGAQANAVLFGVLAGCGVLPFGDEDCRHAIRAAGKAVEANLAGFEAGLALAQKPFEAPSVSPMDYASAPAGLQGRIERLPAPLRALAGHGAARMVDYQNRRAARRYLSRLEQVVAVDSADRNYELSQKVAARLAARMSFEDVMRVAQLKTRPGRLARIRAELGAKPGEPVRVRDYLKPGRAEIVGLLPAFLAWLVPAVKPGPRDVPRGGGVPRGGLALRIPTSSPAGFALMKLLAVLRVLRPFSVRNKAEQAAIARWLEAIIAAAPVHYRLACDTAELAVWARGYGEVRERGDGWLETTLEGWQDKLRDPDGLARQVAGALEAARTDPDKACRA
jgi:indolepyruvate ferredoxin oxidoreductase beta subunit